MSTLGAEIVLIVDLGLRILAITKAVASLTPSFFERTDFCSFVPGGDVKIVGTRRENVIRSRW